MNRQQSYPPPRPVSTRAAENGLVIGGCICGLLLLVGLSTVFAPASLLLWAGSFAMPAVLYKLLKRNYVACGCSMTFVEVWAEGIASFFLGSLVPAVVAYLLLKYAYPDFIAEQLQTTINTFRSVDTPEGEQWAQLLEDVRAQGSLPTATDVAANIISFNIIIGTVIALVDAAILRVRHRSTGPAANFRK